jgi:FG-GAP-like repeat
VSKQVTTLYSLILKRNSKHLSVGATLSIALGLSVIPVQAQSPTILLGNPQATPGLSAQGYVITTNVSQTPTTTTITYNVTQPSTGSANPKLVIGRIAMLTVLPSGTGLASVTTTVSYVGDINVDASGVGGPGFPGLGAQAQSPSPQSFTGNLGQGASFLVFSLGPTVSNPSTITVTMNVGNPNGARKPYLYDFDGSGKTDLTVWRPSEGNWWVNLNSAAPIRITQWGSPGDVPVAGDFDGDGMSDYAVWRPSEGNWYIIFSSTGQQSIRQWGLPGDIPLVGDFDGDGKTDYAVWRPSEGNWYVILSSNGQVAITAWGVPGDIPVIGDFDGDGKTDYAIWRSSEANWYILPSSTGIGTVIQQGIPGDIPVLGDYDGDGKTDYGLWTPSDGIWSIRLSRSGQVALTQWGLPGDIPVPSDYDGDGRTDYVVWRPSEGNWYLYQSELGVQGPIAWGQQGDIPIGQTLTSAP